MSIHIEKKSTAIKQILIIFFLFPIIVTILSGLFSAKEINYSNSIDNNKKTSLSASLIYADEYFKLNEAQKKEHDRQIRSKFNRYVSELGIESQANYDLHKLDIEKKLAYDSQLYVSQTLYPYDESECVDLGAGKGLGVLLTLATCSVK